MFWKEVVIYGVVLFCFGRVILWRVVLDCGGCVIY